MRDIDGRQTEGGVRYDVRFRDPAGRQRKRTFRTKKEAERFLSTVSVEQSEGRWVDPSAGRLTLAEYAPTWMASRPKPLRPRTVELYDGQVAKTHAVWNCRRRDCGRAAGGVDGTAHGR